MSKKGLTINGIKPADASKRQISRGAVVGNRRLEMSPMTPEISTGDQKSKVVVAEHPKQKRENQEQETHLYFGVLNPTTTRKSTSGEIGDVLVELRIAAKPEKILESINSFTIELSSAQYAKLKDHKLVASLERDRSMPLMEPIVERKEPDSFKQSEPEVRLEAVIINSGSATQSATSRTIYRDSLAKTGDILPYGVRAVWGGTDISSLGNAGLGTYAFVIDSGILDTTGDLLLNRGWSRSWINGESPFADGNGHGTHVAGTIGALANGRGVVGVAPGAEIVSLKVFDSNGGGASYSTIIEAVNYATKTILCNNLDRTKCVINLSLGGSYSLGLDQAIKNAANQGIQFTIAAGNNGMDVDAFSPASAGDHPYVYTVSAVDSSYRMAAFSNWDDSYLGDDVDLAAPGVGIYSYYKGGKLEYLSGTSMAAPHVAGLLLMGGVRSGLSTTAIPGRVADPFAITALSSIGAGNQLNSSDLMLEGGSSNDTLLGRSGNDTLIGGVGDDILNGGGGQDTVIFGSGHNRINLAVTGFQDTGEGMDQLIGTENIFAGSGNDSITGNASDNALYGEDGNDTIDGGLGNDRLDGGAGDDWLIGGGGIDQIRGGSGRDTFEVRKNPGYDLIADFKRGEDRLYLGSGVAGLTTTIQDNNTMLYQQGDLLAIITGTGNNSMLTRSGSFLV